MENWPTMTPMAWNWREQVFPKQDNLPADLTSIDILKTVAVGLMIVDHVGWLLFPQIEWLRVFGRMCVPLWFFLIGYSSSREVPARWLAAGVILLISSLAVMLPPLPLCVLFTMALIRLLMDPLWTFLKAKPIYFWWIVLLLVFVGYATDLFVEYGTLGLLLAMAGYARRNEAQVDAWLGAGKSALFMAAALSAFGIIECLKFGFSMLAAMVLAGGFIAIYFVLQTFEVKTYPGTADRASAPLVRFMGRYTLEIYVIHLLILKGVFGLKILAERLIG